MENQEIQIGDVYDDACGHRVEIVAKKIVLGEEGVVLKPLNKETKQLYKMYSKGEFKGYFSLPVWLFLSNGNNYKKVEL